MSDLDYLLSDRKSESLALDYKAWCDLDDRFVRSEIAKDLAALCNHGGGQVVFGVEDKTRTLQGPCPFNKAAYSEDTLSDIIKKYLEPTFQVRFDWVRQEGNDYAVVGVPSHGTRPVVAKSGGPPDDKGRPTGVAPGMIYIRSVGPASAPIRAAEDWNELLERCISKRADLLAAIMRQAIAKPPAFQAQIVDLLSKAMRSTANDYADQAASYVADLDFDKQPLLRAAPANFAVQGYALVDQDGNGITLSSLLNLNKRADAFVRRYAYDGWQQFLQLSVPERSPQLKTGLLDGVHENYLEGMRLKDSNVITAGMDYWRIYEKGIFISAENFCEDYGFARGGYSMKCLSAHRVIVKIHQVLTHARAIGESVPSIAQIYYKMEWQGMAGRTLMYDPYRAVSSTIPAGDFFSKTIIIAWSELRDDYFAVLQRVASAFLEIFASASFDPSEWLTLQRAREELGRSDHTNMRLLD